MMVCEGRFSPLGGAQERYLALLCPHVWADITSLGIALVERLVEGLARVCSVNQLGGQNLWVEHDSMLAVSMAEDDARATLLLLETRLHRVEFLLNGSSDRNGIPDGAAKPLPNETVSERLAKLEDDLARLISKSSLAQDVLRLCTL